MKFSCPKIAAGVLMGAVAGLTSVVAAAESVTVTTTNGHRTRSSISVTSRAGSRAQFDNYSKVGPAMRLQLPKSVSSTMRAYAGPFQRMHKGVGPVHGWPPTGFSEPYFPLGRNAPGTGPVFLRFLGIREEGKRG